MSKVVGNPAGMLAIPDSPAEVRMALVRIMGAEDTGGFNYDLAVSDTEPLAVFTAPKKSIVTKIRAKREKAFATSTGGAVTVTVGDSDDIDGYLTDTLVGTDTAGGDILSGNTQGAYIGGKLYEAGQDIMIQCAGGTVIDDGYLELWIEYVLVAGIDKDS